MSLRSRSNIGRIKSEWELKCNSSTNKHTNLFDGLTNNPNSSNQLKVLQRKRIQIDLNYNENYKFTEK